MIWNCQTRNGPMRTVQVELTSLVECRQRMERGKKERWNQMLSFPCLAAIIIPFWDGCQYLFLIMYSMLLLIYQDDNDNIFILLDRWPFNKGASSLLSVEILFIPWLPLNLLFTSITTPWMLFKQAFGQTLIKSLFTSSHRQHLKSVISQCRFSKTSYNYQNMDAAKKSAGRQAIDDLNLRVSNWRFKEALRTLTHLFLFISRMVWSSALEVDRLLFTPLSDLVNELNRKILIFNVSRHQIRYYSLVEPYQSLDRF